MLNPAKRIIFRTLQDECRAKDAMPLAQKLLETAVEQGASYEQFDAAMRLVDFVLKCKTAKNPLLAQPISSFIDDAKAALEPI